MTKSSLAANAAALFITVVALQDQRCRAGRVFTREPQDIPLDELGDDELEALRSDPFLYVTEAVGDEADAKAKEEADKAAADAKAKEEADKAAADAKAKEEADKAAADAKAKAGTAKK